MRRSDHDVTDTIQTTNPVAVRDEVARIYLDLYGGRSPQLLRRLFTDLARFYGGRDPGYHACDTGYHDIQHVLDVTLAMARMMDGYERSRRNGTPPLPPEMFILGAVAAMYHDHVTSMKGKGTTDVHMTSPYLDALGLGIMITVSMHVHSNITGK